MFFLWITKYAWNMIRAKVRCDDSSDVFMFDGNRCSSVLVSWVRWRSCAMIVSPRSCLGSNLGSEVTCLVKSSRSSRTKGDHLFIFTLNFFLVLAMTSIFVQVGFASRTTQLAQIPPTPHLALVEVVAEGQASAQRLPYRRRDRRKYNKQILIMHMNQHPANFPRQQRLYIFLHGNASTH